MIPLGRTTEVGAEVELPQFERLGFIRIENLHEFLIQRAILLSLDPWMYPSEEYICYLDINKLVHQPFELWDFIVRLKPDSKCLHESHLHSKQGLQRLRYPG